MAYPLPQVGAAGAFSLLAPLNTLLTAGQSYECTAIRSFSDLISQGRDPYLYFYYPYDIAREVYEQHSQENVRIVTLTSSSGRKFDVPNAYLESYPLTGGVPYTVMALGISLGALADQLDLSVIKARIEAVVLESLGVTAQLKEIRVSHTQFVSSAEHEAREATRLALVGSNHTDHSAYLEQKLRADTLSEQNDQLIAYIEALP